MFPHNDFCIPSIAFALTANILHANALQMQYEIYKLYCTRIHPFQVNMLKTIVTMRISLVGPHLQTWVVIMLVSFYLAHYNTSSEQYKQVEQHSLKVIL